MGTNDKPAAQQGQQGQQQNIPPPPPGPSPAQATQAERPKHSNETPLPDYDIPAYNPANPQFAPPPGDDDDIYNASPVDDKPPKWGFHSHHSKDSDGKKKSNRLSALGEAFTSKVAGPVNALVNKFGAEGFLPESLDKECEKAARILRAFCKDGIYTDAIPTAATAAPPADGKPGASPKPAGKKSRTLLTIPSKVIARAQGLAIFTAVRLGFQATGSSGSGILIARLPDGSWSPPSAIQVTSIGAGFVAGVDIYDCVVVINTRQALELFTKTRLSLGSDLAVTAGPFGVGGALDWGVPAPEGKSAAGTKTEPAAATAPAPAGATTSPLSADNTQFATPPVSAEVLSSDEEASSGNKGKAKAKDKAPSALREALKKPVYSYVKSRGLFAGIQVDGTVIVSRDNTNARFYGQPLTVQQILAGEVSPAGAPAPGAATTSTTTTTTTTAAAAAGAATAEEKPHKGVPWPAGAKPLYEVLRAAESGWAQKQAEAKTQGQDPAQPATTQAQPAQPQQIWTPPPPPPPPPSQTTQPAADAARGVTAGVHNLSVNDPAAAPSSSSGLPPEYYTPAAQAKAAEAAAEAEAAQAAGLADNADLPPPPSYFDDSHPVVPGASGAAGGSGDLPPPPAYDDNSRPQGFVPDQKS
ncbi:hypothetical protein VTJ83DRAFT_61 [Remersonia thermophila]|uniref:Ysc84 actin-binding domain-containing protein n=1 Tax=Remersonia thermophila TaxID=72144 RepID=A0ABR4DKK6_9PEZI